MKKLLLLPFLVLIIDASAQLNKNEYYLLLGTYTTGKGEGVYVYRFNSVTGQSDSVSMVKTSNPSYLAVSKEGNTVYAVNENAANGNGGAVSAFSFNKNSGQLSFINQQSSGGDHPCYITADKTNKWIIAGNYSSGTLSVLPISKDGSVGQPVQKIQHEGSGPNRQRQQSAHVHCTLLSDDNKYLFVPDLGMDKVMIYSFDDKTGQLKNFSAAVSEPGAGPRHLVFHPNKKFAYLVEELSSTVVVYAYGNGKLKRLQRISSLPLSDSAKKGSADIHVSGDGKFLYVSNRGGSNTIAVYRINQQTGMLSLLGHQSTLGDTPRNFNFDPSGNFLLVANQRSDNVVLFRINKKTGMLTDTGKRINCGNPVCVKWIP